MVGTELCAITEAVEAKAGQVGADILAEYRQLARALRRKARDEVAALDSLSDPAERACRQCASELYGTAASELDDLVAELLDSLDRPFKSTVRKPVLRILDGGRLGNERRNGQP